jgi:thioredoxin-like negative regulator of GroEL
MPDFFENRRPHNGLDYDAYRAQWKAQIEAAPDGTAPEDRKMRHYLNYNWKRQAHVHDAYTLSEDLRAAVEALSESQVWMVLTEPWCGDSAFLLPVIAEAAALSGRVTLRILLRDDNLDIMDQYLTGGSRSIPKLVAFSEDGHERFTWGPRPDGAADRFAKLQETHDDKQQQVAQLIEYYEDGGWRETDDELAAAIRASTPSAA